MGVVASLACLFLAGAGSALAATPMTDTEFDHFVETARSELEVKQDQLIAEFGLGDADSWFFDQATEKLQFFDDQQRLLVEADIIDVGSYSPKSNSWKWAWGNESVLPALRNKAEKLKELEAITGIKLFGEPHAFEVDDEDTAWDFTAMAARHLGARGCYRAPAEGEGPVIYLLVMNIRKVGH